MFCKSIFELACNEDIMPIIIWKTFCIKNSRLHQRIPTVLAHLEQYLSVRTRNFLFKITSFLHILFPHILHLKLSLLQTIFPQILQTFMCSLQITFPHISHTRDILTLLHTVKVFHGIYQSSECSVKLILDVKNQLN